MEKDHSGSLNLDFTIGLHWLMGDNILKNEVIAILTDSFPEEEVNFSVLRFVKKGSKASRTSHKEGQGLNYRIYIRRVSVRYSPRWIGLPPVRDYKYR